MLDASVPYTASGVLLCAGQGHALPNTVAALDGWGCRNHATFCGLLRWRPTKDKLTGLEELAFCDKHAMFAEYRCRRSLRLLSPIRTAGRNCTQAHDVCAVIPSWRTDCAAPMDC